VAYSITNQIVADFKLDGTCGAMKAYLMVALKVLETYRGGTGDNPVSYDTGPGPAGDVRLAAVGSWPPVRASWGTW
jgi:hypothetical protein